MDRDYGSYFTGSKFMSMLRVMLSVWVYRPIYDSIVRLLFIARVCKICLSVEFMTQVVRSSLHIKCIGRVYKRSFRVQFRDLIYGLILQVSFRVWSPGEFTSWVYISRLGVVFYRRWSLQTQEDEVQRNWW